MLYVTAPLFVITVIALVNWIFCQSQYKKYQHRVISITVTQIAKASQAHFAIKRRAKDALIVFIVAALMFAASVATTVFQSYSTSL
jgi:anaerobic C4-dicarboxylate transporter